MTSLFKKIFTVSYLQNVGLRRLCLVLGILMAIVPTWMFFSTVHVKEEMNLRDAVVSGSSKQQKYVFDNYPYKCNFCEMETNFERWKATFGSWGRTNDLLHADCSKLRDSASCNSARNYLSQRIKVSYYNFEAVSLLLYAFLLFYLPFLVACAIQWIVFGFKEKQPKKK